MSDTRHERPNDDAVQRDSDAPRESVTDDLLAEARASLQQAVALLVRSRTSLPASAIFPAEDPSLSPTRRLRVLPIRLRAD